MSCSISEIFRRMKSNGDTSIDAWYEARMSLLRKQHLPSHLTELIRDFVDPGLRIRCAIRHIYRYYDKHVYPLKQQLTQLEHVFRQRQKYIETTCTHLKKRRLREPGLYGDRYWSCPDCAQEWH